MRTHSDQRKPVGYRKYIGAVLAMTTISMTGVADGTAAARHTLTPERSAVVAQGHVASEPASFDTVGASATAGRAPTSPDRPRLLDDEIGDLVVRLHGGVCSGTPITGTVYVVTAAHCVLTERGEVTQRTVVRDHVRYPAVAVLVDTGYHDHPSEALDAAVLVMAHAIPGPSVSVGAALPDSGSVTLVGFQPIDRDGSLLRGTSTDGLPRSRGATRTRAALPYGPAGCVDPVDALDVSAARVMVPCGLVPGASGGGLYAEHDGELVLVGILSTVTSDHSANGVVPLASLRKLLDHPDLYAHGFHAVDADD